METKPGWLELLWLEPIFLVTSLFAPFKFYHISYCELSIQTETTRQQDLSQGQDSSPDSALPIT